MSHSIDKSWLVCLFLLFYTAVASSIPQTDIAMTASGDNPQNVMKSLQNQSAATKTDIAYSHELSLDDCLGGTNWAAMGEDLDDITKEDKNTFQADFSAKEVVSSEVKLSKN